jgi:hypothetical protein
MTDDETKENTRKAGIERTKHILQSYLSGEPHFTKALLEEMNIKITEYRNDVKKTGLKDGSNFFDTKLPDDS